MNDRQKTVLIRWVLIGVGILLVIILAAEGISNFGKQKIDTAEGLEIIQKAEATDIAMIENKIAGLEAISSNEGEKEDKNLDTRSLKEKFDSSVVMGDSIALGFSEYSILNSSSVVAEIGAQIGDEELVKEQLEKAKEMNPQMIFLCYGINDIKNGMTVEKFVSNYKKRLTYIQKELPDTKIFVDSVFPVQTSVAAEYESLGEIEKYNEKLRELCDDMQIAFLDHTDLVRTQDYEEDGIHFVAAFYERWAEEIAEVAEL